MTGWLGDCGLGDSSRQGDHLIHSTVHDVGSEWSTDTNEISWKGDVHRELDLEGREIGGGQVFSDWDNHIVGGSGSSNSTLWSLVLESSSWGGVGEIGIINSPLSVGTGSTPSPVVVGLWVLLPSGAGGNLNSVVSNLVTHLDDEIPWSLDNNSISPVSHGDGELEVSSLSWELLSGGVSCGDLINSKSDSSWGSSNSHGVEHSVDIHNWTSSSEVVHSGLHGDWSPHSNLDTGTGHGQTVSGVLGQCRSESTSKDVVVPGTSTGVGGGWHSERGRKWPGVNSSGCWSVTRGRWDSNSEVTSSWEITIQ